MKKDAKYTQILKSTNYNQFKFISGNRQLRTLNLSKLRESMKEKQLIVPICVNEKFEIIDGQHRFTICKELKLPVYYYIQDGYNLEDVERANRANSNWDINDFLASFIEKGNETYITISDLTCLFNVMPSDIIRFLAKIKHKSALSVTEQFKNGTIEITEMEKTKAYDFFECLEVFKSFNHYNKPKFISSYLELYCHPKYNHSIMETKFDKYSKSLVHCVTKDEYLEVLTNKIYSMGKADIKNNIYYDKTRNIFYQV